MRMTKKKWMSRFDQYGVPLNPGPFRVVWESLADQGVCPPIPPYYEGGESAAVEEFRRVHWAWKEAGCPEAMEDFIRRTVDSAWSSTLVDRLPWQQELMNAVSRLK